MRVALMLMLMWMCLKLLHRRVVADDDVDADDHAKCIDTSGAHTHGGDVLVVDVAVVVAAVVDHDVVAVNDADDAVLLEGD